MCVYVCVYVCLARVSVCVGGKRRHVCVRARHHLPSHAPVTDKDAHGRLQRRG